MQAFFNQVSSQLTSQLPFVAYRKPNEQMVKALLQQSDDLFYLENYSEAGFIMAPFDSRKETVLLPLKKCETIKAEFDSKFSFQSKSINQEVFDVDKKQVHVNLVSEGIKTIQSGSLNKVVLSRNEKVSVYKSPIEIFENLLMVYPSAFVYYWYHPKIGTWLGATPETLLKIENNRFSTMALAGTQVYHGTLDVTWGEKEKEEQNIVTKAIVEGLESKVEHIDSSQPITLLAGNLLHLKTTISGTLKDNNELESVLLNLHPTPAVCGSPKQVAKDFILENEGYNREFYTGYLGELNLQETRNRNTNQRNIENNAYNSIKKVSNLYVNLRCMKLEKQEAYLYVGGGITNDSDPELEWEETIEKTKTMKRVL